MIKGRLSLLTAATVLLSVYAAPLQAQELRWLRNHIVRLGSPSMDGRGYVKNGRERAAKYIGNVYRQIGLQSFLPDSSYYQQYTFPVNTFPGEMLLRVNRKTLRPGADYLVDAASNGFEGRRMRIKTINLLHTDSLAWEKERLSLRNTRRVYYLKHADSLCARLSIQLRRLPKQLPKGCFIIPQHDRLVWTVATDTIPATVFHVADTALPRWMRRADVQVRNVFLKQGKNRNVIGYVPGTEVPDSFIVFTAHYDHLGRMGLETCFPGACDNASGTAFMLYLARYFAAHPQRYSVAFMAFSGEEAGLFGSEYYADHPFFPLSSIRFLVNIDMMGDAKDGITAVNAPGHPAEFTLLQKLNESKGYLTEIKSRENTSNSDHYHFTRNGMPAFFLYANSGAGFYHDIYDKPATITLNKIENVAKLLEDFVSALQHH